MTDTSKFKAVPTYHNYAWPLVSWDVICLNSSEALSYLHGYPCNLLKHFYWNVLKQRQTFLWGRHYRHHFSMKLMSNPYDFQQWTSGISGLHLQLLLVTARWRMSPIILLLSSFPSPFICQTSGEMHHVNIYIEPLPRRAIAGYFLLPRKQLFLSDWTAGHKTRRVIGQWCWFPSIISESDSAGEHFILNSFQQFPTLRPRSSLILHHQKLVN